MNAHGDPAPSGHESPRGTRSLALVMLCFAVLCAGFASLGDWQIQRLAWKRDLIARVDARVHAPPVAPPARKDWPRVDGAHDEYRRVRLHGRYLPGKDVHVQAVTELGPGWWVMTPFATDDSGIVLVNRGFVPQDVQAPRVDDRPRQIIGLLRLSEPGGAFLRDNKPREDRWYSRDVQAIATALGLHGVAPYFVDVDATSNGASQWPRGGMTVITFRNQHLQYAITWFALALLSLLGGGYWIYSELRRRVPKDAFAAAK